MNILEVKNLKVSYGNIEAVKGIDIEVKKGSVTTILGSNGAGKTTTLMAITGLLEKSGEVLFDGESITSLPAEKVAKLGVAISPEGRQLFPELTVEENLRAGAFTVKSRAKVKENFDRVYKFFPRLEERKKQVAQTLSGGEQQMLAIGRALMASPKLLLLDEPSLGLAPLIIKDIFEIITEFKNMGTSILMVEQNALQSLKIADYAYVLKVGEVSMQGKAEELIEDPMLVDAYLGKN